MLDFKKLLRGSPYARDADRIARHLQAQGVQDLEGLYNIRAGGHVFGHDVFALVAYLEKALAATDSDTPSDPDQERISPAIEGEAAAAPEPATVRKPSKGR